MDKVCNNCRHLQSNEKGRPYCIAFPDGIPYFLYGEEHIVPYPHQVGDTVFEPIEPDKNKPLSV